MSEGQRLASFSDFWPHYLGEHRRPASRHLHFVGTSVFGGTVVASLVVHPVRMGACVVGAAMVAFLARSIEARRRAVGEALAIAAVLVIGSPWVGAGIAVAYGCAWVGHFAVERNRPATFTYPLWSLFGDVRMVGRMWSGRMWSGEPEP